MTENRIRDRRKYRWLSAIADHLSAPAKQILADLQSEFGDLDSPDRLWGPVTVEIGREISPVSGVDLESWSVKDIVRYCLAFMGPEESFNNASKEGLAQAISIQAAARPREFAVEALEFRALVGGKLPPNPRYVQALLRGLRESLGQAGESSEVTSDFVSIVAALTGSPVTDLILWLEQLPDLEENHYQPGWESARLAAADLLLDVLERIQKMPSETIASILEVNELGILNAFTSLQRSRSPTPFDQSDPITLAINSTRGRSLLAAMAFSAAWFRAFSSVDSSAEKLHPSIRDFFDEVLSKEIHPAVRCIFGWRFPYLFQLSRDWATSNTNLIYPTPKGKDAPIWRASWDAYVLFNRLYTDVWITLRDYYALAVSMIGTREGEALGTKESDEDLGGHIFLAWFSGLEDSEAILSKLLAVSSDQLKGRLSWYGARVLHANVAAKELGDDSNEWLKLELYLKGRTGQGGLFGHSDLGPEEAAGFVDWLEDIPKPLPAMFPVIEKIASTLQIDDRNEWQAGNLISFLCSQADQFPAEAVALLYLVSTHGWPRWLRGEQIESVKNAMRRGLALPEGPQIVRQLIGELSKMHHFEYREIIEEYQDGI